MVEIKLYSNESYSTEYLKAELRNRLNGKGVKFKLSQITDPKEFDGLENIPTIEHQGEKFQNVTSSLSDYANDASAWLLEREKLNTFSNIIVPIDYSDCSENALAYAVDFADFFKSTKLELAHVYKPQATVALKTTVEYPQLIIGAQSKFKDYKEIFELANKSNLEIASNFVVGFPGDEIVQMSKNGKDKLLVLGTTGENLGVKSLLGSVSIRAAKNASCPTLIVPPKSKFKPYKSILVCVTNENDSLGFKRNIVSLLDKNDGVIHLFNQNDDSSFDAQAKLKEWSEYFEEQRIKMHVIKRNEFVYAVNKYVPILGIDLVSLNRSDRSTISQLFNSSKTKKIAISCPVPFLIFHNK